MPTASQIPSRVALEVSKSKQRRPRNETVSQMPMASETASEMPKRKLGRPQKAEITALITKLYTALTETDGSEPPCSEQFYFSSNMRTGSWQVTSRDRYSKCCHTPEHFFILFDSTPGPNQRIFDLISQFERATEQAAVPERAQYPNYHSEAKDHCWNQMESMDRRMYLHR